jgi:repressor LexA
MLPITDRQQQVLSFITSYIDKNGYPPSQREIAFHLGVSGTLPVIKHLEALEKKGFLKRDSSSRSIVLTTPAADSASLPIVGTVRAGQLTPAVEDIQGYFALDRLQLHGGKFFLRVKGDSMINAAICDGDLALVRPQPTAENRDIVVAMVDGEATLKEFYREQGHVRLQPRNPNMEPIIIKDGAGEVVIVGKVVGIFRNMG